MLAPLPVPHLSSGFSQLATAGGQTARPGGLTMPGIEADGQTMSPGSQTAHGIEVDGLTATPSGQTTWPFTASSLPASPTSVAPRTMPTTSVVPHTAPTTPPAPSTAPTSMTPLVPPAALASQHYSRCPRAMREPPAPPLFSSRHR
jgi:hypothetical protein